MALPVLSPNALTPARTGIPLAIVPSSDPTCDVELWRLTTQSGSTYAWLARLKANAIGGRPYAYPDPLPLDNYTYAYKARSIAVGRWPSTFSAAVSSKPAALGANPVPALSLNARGLGTNTLFLSTAAKVKYGTGKAAATAAKYVWLHHTTVVPSDNTQAYTLSAGDIRPGAILAPNILYGNLTLPPGATVTGFKARLYRGNATSTATAVLERVSGTSVQGVGSQVTHVTTTWAELASTAISNALVGDQRYVVQVRLGAATTAGNARFAGARIDYTIPDLGVGV